MSSTEITGIRPRRLRRMLALVAFGTILAGGATGVARADTIDDIFIRVLDNQGITYTSEALAIQAGHAVCELRDTGYSEMGAAAVVMNNSPLTAYNAGFFVGAAEGAFCPWWGRSQGAGSVSA